MMLVQQGNTLMKLKNRANLFLVVRDFEKDGFTEVPIAGFLTLQSAEEYAGVCAQEFEERDIKMFLFKVIPLIYYDM